MSHEERLRKGKVTILKHGDIARCPHYIIAPEHYKPDGTCFCNDPNAAIMAEWGYKWDPEKKQWESDLALD